MRIESNVAGVLERTVRLCNRDIPAAMTRALHPDQWAAVLRFEADLTLMALASPKERRFVPAFIETLLTGPFGNGFFSRMHSPFAPDIPFQIAPQQNIPPPVGEGSRYDALTIPPGDDAFTNFLGQMMEWVETEKNWDVQRDGEKNMDTIIDKADWLAYVMLTKEGGELVVAEGPNAGKYVRDVFMPYIITFLQEQEPKKRQPVKQLDAATVDEWLRAVLARWGVLLRDRFPTVLRKQLRLARAERVMQPNLV